MYVNMRLWSSPLLSSLIPEEDWPVDHVEAGEAEREHNQEHRVHKGQLVTVPVTSLWRSEGKFCEILPCAYLVGLSALSNSISNPTHVKDDRQH